MLNALSSQFAVVVNKQLCVFLNEHSPPSRIRIAAAKLAGSLTHIPQSNVQIT